MNIYDVAVLENQIEQIAKENEGEIPEELLRELVESNTGSVVQIEKLCKYVKHLDLLINSCDSEVKRINDFKSKAKNRQESIKKYMTPFVKEKGKFNAGTFALSTRKSERLELDEHYEYLEYEREKISLSIDKAQIKKDLKNGGVVPGAKIKEIDNLQIK